MRDINRLTPKQYRLIREMRETVPTTPILVIASRLDLSTARVSGVLNEARVGPGRPWTLEMREIVRIGLKYRAPHKIVAGRLGVSQYAVRGQVVALIRGQGRSA